MDRETQNGHAARILNGLRGIGEYRSTREHCTSQRACATTELFNTSIVQPFTTTGLIPVKTAQIIVSTQAFFKPNLKPIERSAHCVQALIAMGQVIVLSLLYFEGEECTIEQKRLCKYWTFLNFFYNATLLVGWIPAEVARSASPINERNTVSSTSSENESHDFIDVKGNDISIKKGSHDSSDIENQIEKPETSTSVKRYANSYIRQRSGGSRTSMTSPPGHHPYQSTAVDSKDAEDQSQGGGIYMASGSRSREHSSPSFMSVL